MGGTKKPRLKRLKQADKATQPAFSMTQRDTEIIRFVYEYRALTTAQIRFLSFGGKQRSTQCDLRLKLLYHHGYLERRSQATLYEENKPLIYLVKEKGARHLAAIDGVGRSQIYWRAKFNQISQHHIRHLLQVNDIRSAIEKACDNAAYDLAWVDEFTIRRHKLYDKFQMRAANGAIYTTTLLPDGFFTIDTPNFWVSCFLEVDRGTESLKTIAQKINKYLTYFTTDAYQKRYGGQDEEGNAIYPCVLTLTTSRERLEHIRQVAETLGVINLFLFATFADVTREHVLSHPIWWTATTDKPVCLIE